MSDVSATSTDKGLHTDFVKHRLPGWLRHATAAQIKALSLARHPGKLAHNAQPPWFAQASPELRQVLRDSQARSRASTQALAKILKDFKGVVDFAQPLLTEALHKRFGSQIDVKKNMLYHLRVGKRIEFQTLLQAALRNFEADESFDEVVLEERSALAPEDALEIQYYGEPNSRGAQKSRYKIANKLPIKPQDFATLCRELDVGKQYQDHLTAVFEASDTKAQVREAMVRAQKDLMEVDAHIAFMKLNITPTAYTTLLAIIKGTPAPKLDDKAVIYSQLHVLGGDLSDILVIGARSRKTNKEQLSLLKPLAPGGVGVFIPESVIPDSRIIVYIPGDPLCPVKEHASLEAFEKDLAINLRSQSYQRFFSGFVSQDKLNGFFVRLKSQLKTYKWNPNPEYPGPPYNPGAFDGGIYEEVWNDAADLSLSEAFVEGKVFDELHDRHLARIKDNARLLAIPTAQVDHDAWIARLKHYAEWGLDILNVAAFFVPAVGALMLAVTAVQLSIDVYHGIEAWELGDTDEAWAHLESVALNVAFMAALGAVASKAPAIKQTSLVDGLLRVKLPFGEPRLWKPDISAYKSDVVLDEGLKPNVLGQYEVAGKTYIRQEGNVYEKIFDPSLKKWRIKHPSDPDAYQPILHHNHYGAWRHSLERPLDWDRPTLLRRMGHVTDSFSEQTLEHIADVSGVSDDVLRQMHVDNRPPSPQLTEALKLFKIEQETSELIEQIRTGALVPDNRYNYSLPIVVNMPRWPAGRVIEVFDGPGLTGAMKRYGSAFGSTRLPIQVTSAEVSSGLLSERILSFLDEQEISRFLGGEGARVEVERANVLREQMADYGMTRKADIFDSIYKGTESVVPEIQLFKRDFPGLSTSAAQELLANATRLERLRMLDNKRIPLRLAEQARKFVQQRRLSQACAGLYLESLASFDSERLALHALEQLPGWSNEVRLEVRDGSLRGTLLDSIGSETAGQLKYLVKEGNQYRAYDEEGNALNSVPKHGNNFFSSIMHALPDGARRELGLPHVSQSAELQKTLTTYAVGHRVEMMKTLGLRPIKPRFKLPMRLADGRLGYPLSGRGAGAKVNPSLISRMRDVYPYYSDDIAETVIEGLLLDGKTESQIFHWLNMRVQEFEELQTVLSQWVDTAQSVGSPGRRQVADRIIECWRLRGVGEVKTSVGLDMQSVDNLPVLPGDFSHIRTLYLNDGLLIEQSLDVLRQFPNVKRLGFYPESRNVARLTGILGGLPAITELSLLGWSGVRYPGNVQQLLNAMPQLEKLTLVGSMEALDVSRLIRLRELSLPDQKSWPSGVLELEHLEKLSLGGTGINSLPAGLFSGHERLWRGLSLNWSALDRESFMMVYQYLHDHPGHLVDTERMVESYCRGVLERIIPRDFQFPRAVMTHLKGEELSTRALLDRVNNIDQEQRALRQQLDEWQDRSLLVNREPVYRHNRVAAAEKIHACWRNGLRQRYVQEGAVAGPSWFTPADYSVLDLSGPVLGDLPALPPLPNTGYRHVQTLRMHGLVASTEDFNRFLSNFPDVRSLVLGSNKLTDIPLALSDFGQLTDLDFSRNQLIVTPGIQGRLNRLSALESLNLQYNRVGSLDVSSMTRLKSLYLEHTAIREWPKGVLGLPAIEHVDLSHSAITMIPDAALAEHDHLFINLRGCQLTQKARTDLLAFASHENADIPMGIPKATLLDGKTGGEPEYFPPLVSEKPDLLLSFPLEPGDGKSRLTPAARLQRLDPGLGDREAIRLVEELQLRSGDVGQMDDQLMKWDEQHQALTQKLNAWIETPPHQEQAGGDVTWVSATERRQAADRIFACWRQNLRGMPAVEGSTGGYILDLSGVPLGNFPDLPGEFAHVGTLNLSGVDLSAQDSNGFLKAFTRIHTLELNNNRLVDLPEPVASLENLTRLAAARNDLESTDQLQDQLNALTHLESLNLGSNGLDRADVTRLTRLHTLDLSGNQLTDWPQGVLDIPALRTLNLSNNMIETIPERILRDELHQLMRGTDLSDNVLLEEDFFRLQDHLERTGYGLGFSSQEIENLLRGYEPDTSSDGSSVTSDEEVDAESETVSPDRWIDPSAESANELTGIWDELKQEENSSNFFYLLSRMTDTKDFINGQADLTRRVWGVLRAAHSDESLRKTIFTMARSAQTCSDGRILLFSDIEVKVFEFEALRSIPADQQGSALFRLGRNLFRLGKVERIAGADIAQRRVVDPAEVRLAYRIGLAQRLELPGQPKGMLYSGLARVSSEVLASAYAEVIQAENTADFMDELVGRKYWADYLKRKYPDRFTALQQQQAPRQEALESQYADLNDEYFKELGALEVVFKTEEAQLLIELSETERAEIGL